MSETQHQKRINEICSIYGARPNGLHSSLRQIFGRLYGDHDEIPRCPRYPGAHLVIDNHTIVMFECEDTNTLCLDKLQDYANWWWDVDCILKFDVVMALVNARFNDILQISLVDAAYLQHSERSGYDIDWKGFHKESGSHAGLLGEDLSFKSAYRGADNIAVHCIGDRS